jgi:beta-glucanase (GH16 family)
MLLVAAAVVVVLGAAYVAVIRPLSSITPEVAPAPSEPGAGPHRPQAGATASASAAAPGATGQPPQGGPSGMAMPTGDLPGWRQTLADDFTTTVLGPQWYTYNGQPDGDPGGFFLPSHVSVGGGQLTISAFPDPAHGGIYVTGGVSTRAAQTYGRYEVRFKMAQGKGIAYALLLWPESNVYPPEIDFAEDNGRDRTKMYASLHPASGGKTISRNVGGDFSQWHTAGLEWTPGKLVLTLDGQEWSRITGPVPTEGMTMALQTPAWYCGHGWEACPDATTPPQVNLDIDWVVSYDRTG